MKLIHKIEKQLNDMGFLTKIDSFSDNSSKWIEIYQSEKHYKKGRSIGSISFNMKGTIMTDMGFHSKNDFHCFSIETKKKS